MATADVSDARLVRVWLSGNTAVGNKSKRLCAMQTKNLNMTKNMTEQPVPDCDDPSLPPTIRRVVGAKDFEITGRLLHINGVEHTNLRNAFESKSAQAMAFEIPKSLAGLGGGYYTGNFYMTQYNFAADENDFLRADVTFQADGNVTWVGPLA